MNGSANTVFSLPFNPPPAIQYDLNFSVNVQTGAVAVSGAVTSYPTFVITASGSLIYVHGQQFGQGYIYGLRLVAEIDVKFAAAHSWKRYLSGLSMSVTALVMTGCSVQLGQFFSTSTLCYSLEPTSGLISIERGNRWFRRRAVDGNVLCVLVLAPTLRFQTGPSFLNESFTSSRRFCWNSDAGPVTLSYNWNRLSDNVNIDEHHFSRKMGNAFVVSRSPNRKWSVRQIASVQWTDDARAVLRHFQRNLPNEHFAADLSLVELPE